MDFGAISSLLHRPRQAHDVRFAGERLALNLRALLPQLEARGAGGASAQLLQDLQGIADTGLDVVLVLPSAGGPARIESGRREIVLPASLRDAVLAFVQSGSPARTAPAGAPVSFAAAGPVAVPAAQALFADATALARGVAASVQASIAAATAGAGAFGVRQAGRATERDRAAAAIGFTQAIFTPTDSAAAADAAAFRLRSAIEHSGLFFESHLAQWVRGERRDETIAQELLRILPNPGQQERSLPPTRVAMQLEVLQQQAVVLQGPAWHGQPMTLSISRRSPEGNEAAGNGPEVFETTLSLDLPRLGPVQAKLRLSGATIAVTIESPGFANAASFDAALPDLRQALEAHGLTPVLLQSVAADAAGVDS